MIGKLRISVKIKKIGYKWLLIVVRKLIIYCCVITLHNFHIVMNKKN